MRFNFKLITTNPKTRFRLCKRKWETYTTYERKTKKKFTLEHSSAGMARTRGSIIAAQREFPRPGICFSAACVQPLISYLLAENKRTAFTTRSTVESTTWLLYRVLIPAIIVHASNPFHSGPTNNERMTTVLY